MKATAVTAATAVVLLATAAAPAVPHAAGPAAHHVAPAAAPAAAGPAQFTVDTTSDAVDADGSDGRCLTASGACSLRAAVMAANARPGSTITLPPGHYRLAIPPDPRLIIGDNPDPTTGDLNVTAPPRSRAPAHGPQSSTPTSWTGPSACRRTPGCPT